MTLKELRLYHNLTQVELAKRLGVVNSSISYWESGKRKPPIKVLDKYATTLGVSTDKLLDIILETYRRV